MRTVGTTECIGRSRFQFRLYFIEIAFRKDAIRIQYDQKIPLTPLSSIIAALPRPGIRFLIIFQVKHRLVLFRNSQTRNRRTVLDYNHFKIFKMLLYEALQQFVHLVGTVIHRYDDGISHIRWFYLPAKIHHYFNKKRDYPY